MKDLPNPSLLLLLADESREVRTEAGREIFRRAGKLVEADGPRECYITDYYARLLHTSESVPAELPQEIMRHLLQETREHGFTDYVRDASWALMAIWPQSAPACEPLLLELKRGKVPDSDQIGLMIGFWSMHSLGHLAEILSLLGPEAMSGVQHEIESLLHRHPALAKVVKPGWAEGRFLMVPSSRLRRRRRS